MYPTSLANLVVEVGARHSHQILLTDTVVLVNSIWDILTKFDVFAQRNVALSWLSFENAI